jgi:hypothetical protein
VGFLDASLKKIQTVTTFRFVTSMPYAGGCVNCFLSKRRTGPSSTYLGLGQVGVSCHKHFTFIDHLTKEITYQNNSTPFKPGFQPVSRI